MGLFCEWMTSTYIFHPNKKYLRGGWHRSHKISLLTSYFAITDHLLYVLAYLSAFRINIYIYPLLTDIRQVMNICERSTEGQVNRVHTFSDIRAPDSPHHAGKWWIGRGGGGGNKHLGNTVWWVNIRYVHLFWWLNAVMPDAIQLCSAHGVGLMGGRSMHTPCLPYYDDW
jgi:hypothetical protein